MKKLIVAVLLCGLFAIGLAGCSSKPSSAAPSGGTSATKTGS